MNEKYERTRPASSGVGASSRYEIVARAFDMHAIKAGLARRTLAVLEPEMQRHGDVMVLTYRLHTEGTLDGKQADTDWNSTSVYARVQGRWQMIHSHWSLTALPCANGIM
jgi:ketosteroid isomerase-like protein